MRNVVIVGGGFGGVAAVNALVEALTPRRRIQVTLISENEHFLFTPLLPNASGGDITASSICVPLREAVGDRVDLQIDRIEGIDLPGRIVHGHLSHSYDALILSPGAQTSWGDNPEWAEHSMTCKSASDAEGIRAHIDANIAIADLTDEFTAREALTLVRFVLIDRKRRILADMSAELAEICRMQLDRMGVEIITQTRVSEIDEEGVMTPRGLYRSKNVIWCGGVRGANWLTSTGLPLDHFGRIKVDERLKVQGESNVYAIGDSASGPWPWSAQVATQQAAIASQNVLADLTGQTWSRFEYVYEGDILSLGRNNAAIYYRGVAFEGRTAHTLHRILYTALVPSGVRKMLVFRDWLAAGFRKPQPSRLGSEK
jgi:NADH dehydrogenase